MIFYRLGRNLNSCHIRNIRSQSSTHLFFASPDRSLWNCLRCHWKYLIRIQKVEWISCYLKSVLCPKNLSPSFHLLSYLSEESLSNFIMLCLRDPSQSLRCVLKTVHICFYMSKIYVNNCLFILFVSKISLHLQKSKISLHLWWLVILIPLSKKERKKFLLHFFILL